MIGVGPIGCELGQSFARFGTDVTFITLGNKILPKEDTDASQMLHQQMADDGINFLFETTPIGINVLKSEGKIWTPNWEFELEVKNNDGVRTIKGDSILLATGRTPNIDSLGLDKAGISYDPIKGIMIDEYGLTTNKNVYAVGDVCSKYHFTHASDHMARSMALNAFLFGRNKYSDLKMSWWTYTDPEIAQVGMTKSELEQSGVKYDLYEQDYSRNDRAICDSSKGFIKLYTDKGSDRILGCTIVGGPAGDMICHVANAMENKVGLKSLGAGVHPYPTYGEAFKALTTQYTINRMDSKIFKFGKKILSLIR